MEELTGIVEHFHLRYNYTLEPKENAEHRHFIASRKITESQTIEEHLKFFKTDLMADITPKRIYVGDNGNGKSHVMLYVADKLSEYNFKFVHVDCPALNSRSLPIEIFKEFLLGLGGKKIILELINEGLKVCRKKAVEEKHMEFIDNPEKTLEPYLDEMFLHDSDFMEYAKFAKAPETENKVWAWLMGGRPDSNISAIDLSRDISALIRVYKIIFKLYHSVKGKKLVVIFDELDKGRIVGSNEAEAWKEVHRQLTDNSQRSAGIIMALTPETYESNKMIDGSTESRVHSSNVIQMTKMEDPEENKKFINEIIVWNREKDFDFQKHIIQYKDEVQTSGSSETVNISTFPFTQEAIESLVNNMTSTTPRAVLYTLNRACALAKSDDKHIVTEKYVKEATTSFDALLNR